MMTRISLLEEVWRDLYARFLEKRVNAANDVNRDSIGITLSLVKHLRSKWKLWRVEKR